MRTVSNSDGDRSSDKEMFITTNEDNGGQDDCSSNSNILQTPTDNMTLCRYIMRSVFVSYLSVVSSVSCLSVIGTRQRNTGMPTTLGTAVI